jgi:hypothetical protein
MRGGTMRMGLRGSLAAMTTVAVCGCGASPITSARIERSIEPTFANLVNVQVSWLGLPPMSASDFAVAASCRRLLEGSNAGSGDWECRLVWQGPDRQTLHDTYDLSVTTDGCYTATVAGENLGGPTLEARDGSDVRNLLYVFEGCFDTT